MDYSFCFSLGGNLDFLDFLQKKFYNIDYWSNIQLGAKSIDTITNIVFWSPQVNKLEHGAL